MVLHAPGPYQNAGSYCASVSHALQTAVAFWQPYLQTRTCLVYNQSFQAPTLAAHFCKILSDNSLTSLCLHDLINIKSSRKVTSGTRALL